MAALVLLAACASPTSSPLPSRPPVPEGWIRFTTAQRDLAVTVPGEFRLDDNQSGIVSGFHDPAANPSSVGVAAIGPTVVSQPTPPFTESSLAVWLLSIISSRRPESYESSSVLLPIGPAVEVRLTFDSGTPDEVAVVAYAIPSRGGVAYLMANCQAEPLSECDEFLRLVPQLYELNLPAD